MEEIEVLNAYSSGTLSRSQAMSMLGLTWFGQLFDLMNNASIPMPASSEAYTKKMTEDVINLLNEEHE